MNHRLQLPILLALFLCAGAFCTPAPALAQQQFPDSVEEAVPSPMYAPPMNTSPMYAPPMNGQMSNGRQQAAPGMSAAPLQQNYATRDTSVRIKDITYVDGERNNHVSGESLVVGLAGTGGKAEQTRAMAQNYFQRRGIQVGKVETKNMSAVLVSGQIPPYARKGDTFQVNVSVVDDAKSLYGGTLNEMMLRGLDGEVYAVAYGPIVAGGVSAGGAAASVQRDHPTVGTCDAIVERQICPDRMPNDGRIRLILRNKDYSTVTHITNALNATFPHCAQSLDSGTVEIIVPRTFGNSLPAFISMIGDLRVQPDMRARVVINQKTGTIVMGSEVKISKVLMASGSIVITTAESPIASQPAPLSNGQTVVLPRTTVNIVEQSGTYNVLNQNITVGDLAHALNTLAVPTASMINIFTTLRNQGALQAELVIE